MLYWETPEILYRLAIWPKAQTVAGWSKHEIADSLNTFPAKLLLQAMRVLVQQSRFMSGADRRSITEKRSWEWEHAGRDMPAPQHRSGRWHKALHYGHGGKEMVPALLKLLRAVGWVEDVGDVGPRFGQVTVRPPPFKRQRYGY